MDQTKTGKFISELRKEKEMTQTELAGIIGVSEKTVSKWETGRGMPEISTLPVLCETLGISVNELLTGERVPAESYTEQAEENMVTLLKDSKSYNKDRSVLAVAVPIIAVIALTLLILFTWGQRQPMWFVDLPTILFIAIVTTIFLIAAGSYGDLWRAFRYAAGFGEPTEEKLENAMTAVVLAGKAMLVSSSFLSVISVVICLIDDNFPYDDIFIFLSALAVAILPLFYGFGAYLLSLPIKARLERKIARERLF